MRPGQTISHYAILEKLGEGGMGVVYRADDTILNRPVAVKFLRTSVLAGENEKARFFHEARAAAILDHPNICTVHEIDEVDGQPFIVMALLEGQTVADRIASGPMTVEDTIRIAIEAAEGLSAAHEKGIIHRDIKSSNIFITSSERVKILDFGLAIRADGSRLTGAGRTLGTISYMSPEQARGEDLDHRSDIWSLGVVIYEMIAGRLPFRSEYDQAIVYQILHDEPPGLDEIRGDIPKWLVGLVNRMLEKDPVRRYRDTGALLIDLRRAGRLEQEARTPSGPVGGAHIPRSPRLKRITYAVAAVVLAAAGFLYYRSVQHDRVFSLAILPLINTGQDSSADYLGDGITESLINGLARLPEMKIISWAGVSRFKGRRTNPDSVGRALRVESVLTGSIVTNGEDLEVSVELVSVDDNSHIWGEKYRRGLSDILQIQDDITDRILANLGPALSGVEREEITRRSTDDPEAYRSYLRGRYYWNQYSEEGFRQAIHAFTRALEIDPAYALAYAGLADAYYGMSNLYMSPREAIPRARAAAERALSIDESLSEAHTSIAIIMTQYDWNWAKAGSEFRRAIELKPNNAAAHQFYAWNLMATGKVDEAMAEVTRARDLDPLSPFLDANVAWLLYFARDFEGSARHSRSMLDLDSTFAVALVNLGQACEGLGKFSDALEAYRKAARIDSANHFLVGSMGYCLGRSGDRAGALDALASLREISRSTRVDPFHYALIYLGLGESDEVFEWLDRAYDDRSEELLTLKVSPRFDVIRNDPRYSALLRRMGLAS